MDINTSGALKSYPAQRLTGSAYWLDTELFKKLLMSIVEQAGATLVGCAVAIEKGFQGGGDELRQKGVKVESLAIIDSMDDGKIVFRQQ